MGRSFVVQARVPAEIAEHLPGDIEALGLEGTSDAIREGLQLLHRKARMVALGQSYDSFYGDEPAPLSDVAAALYPDD
jgi:hypothetical protein